MSLLIFAGSRALKLTVDPTIVGADKITNFNNLNDRKFIPFWFPSVFAALALTPKAEDAEVQIAKPGIYNLTASLRISVELNSLTINGTGLNTLVNCTDRFAISLQSSPHTKLTNFAV